MTDDKEMPLTFPKDDGLHNIYVWALFLVSAVYMLGNVWMGSLLPGDEGAYGQIAREIVVAKEGWLTLHLNNEPWFEKPPLYIWLIALTYKIFGVNEFSVRLWSALFGYGCVVLVYFLSIQFFISKRIALFSPLVLIGFTQFVKQSKMGMMDGPLTFFILLGLFLFWIGRKEDRYLLFVGITAGVAFMVKSFAAFLLPIIIAVFGFASGETKKLTNGRLLSGFAIGILLCLPWHIYECMKWGNAFADEYFFHHIVRRAVDGLGGNRGGALYYFEMLLSQNIPLGALSFLAVPYILYSIRSERDGERKTALVLVAVSVAVTYILFSLVKTKIITYIMPAYPFLALAIAATADRVVGGKRLKDPKILIMFLIVLAMIPSGRIFFDRHRTLDYSPGLKKSSLSAKTHSNERDILYLYEIPEFWEILFYSERKIDPITRDDFLRKASASNPFLCLMSKSDGFFAELKKNGLTALYEDEEYVLYQRQ